MKKKLNEDELIDKYFKWKYGKNYESPFTKEEIKWWVDLALIQNKIIKIKAEKAKRWLFKEIIKIKKDIHKAYEFYAKQLNKEVKELTKKEKREAFERHLIQLSKRRNRIFD